MAGQYWPDATLLPTVATKWALYKNIPLFGTGCVGANADDEIIHNYFDCKFLPGRPKLRSINEWHFTILTPTLASVQGTYIFDKPLQIIRARFTYVLEKRKNEPDWYIIQHHSSIANYDAEPFGPIEQRPGPPAPPDPLPCPWDFNGDGVVNWHDLLELVDNWGPCPDDETVGADANVGVIGGQLHESKESENKK